MKEDIIAAKEIIKKQVNAGRISIFGVPFSKYQKVYGFTNENIDGYLSQMNLDNKDSALCVMASADHFLNLIYYGITQIDTFDSNQLTEYYGLGIKRSAILAFSYEEYLKFYEKILDLNTSLEEITELTSLLLPFMETKHRIFWESILSYNYELQRGKEQVLNLFHMLLINIQNNLGLTFRNTYLFDSFHYEYVRKRLASTTIRFCQSDCLELHEHLCSSYDSIFLSNIPDYLSDRLGFLWNYQKLEEVTSYFKKFLNDNGFLAFSYMIQCYSSYSNTFKTNLILNSSVSAKDLTSEEILLFPHILNAHISTTVKDGLLLERKLS